MLKHKNFLLVLLITLFLSGCSSKIPTHEQRMQTANNIITTDMLRKTYTTNFFNLLTYSSSLATCQNKQTNVYIEGDGLAWVSSSMISDDPTPINPVSLEMFMQDDVACKLYIARPCQYVNSGQCNKKYWTSHRFSTKVIESYNETLDAVKEEYKLNRFNVIGYSGGGAIAAIIAAKRNDINKLVTVAGNIDTDFWTKKHHITPLHGSLNPADFSDRLKNVKQYHFIGGKDKIIDKSIFESYIKKFKNIENIKFKIVEGFTHNCCWSEGWKELKSSINKTRK